jgi:hypothetical protein
MLDQVDETGPRHMKRLTSSGKVRAAVVSKGSCGSGPSGGHAPSSKGVKWLFRAAPPIFFTCACSAGDASF